MEYFNLAFWMTAVGQPIKLNTVIARLSPTSSSTRLNDIAEKDDAHATIYQFNFCDYTKTRNELEDHVLESHIDQVGNLVRKVQDHNLESIKLLEDIPECILTPEEVGPSNVHATRGAT